jgi:hypothetical protein
MACQGSESKSICYENAKTLSKIFQKFFESQICLLQNGLQRFRFDAAVHRHTRMQTILCIVPMRARLTNEFKIEAFQSAAEFVP